MATPLIRPRPTDAHAAEAPIPPGPKRLEKLASRNLRRMGASRRSDIRAWAAKVATWLLASVCTGSGSDCMIWAALSAALKDDLDVALSVQHAFLSEQSGSKQEFLHRLYPDSIIFINCKDLPYADTATAHGRRVLPVPKRWQNFTGGFPCTSASGLSTASGSDANRRCVANEDLATGSVFAAIIGLLEERISLMREDGEEFLLVVLENVLRLATPPRGGGASNLDVCISRLQALGLLCAVFHLTPADFGVPASRPRIYIVCAIVPNMDQGTFAHVMADCMNSIVGSALDIIDNYLLPETSKYIQDQLAQSKAKVAGRQGDSLGAVLDAGGIITNHVRKHSNTSAESCLKPRKWHAKHEQYYEGRPDLWWPEAHRCTAEQLSAFPTLSAIGDRQMEVLQYSGVTEFPERAPRTIEVKHNLDRTHVLHGIASTILPGGEQYLTHRCRLMHPIEAIRLQGIFVPSEVADDFLGLLQDLGGNAFETSCCLAATMCGLAALAHSISSIAVPRPLNVPDDDSSSESSSLLRLPKRKRLT